MTKVTNLMNIPTLCEKIGLQPVVKSRVLTFADEYDFASVDHLLREFRCYEKMSEALEELQTQLGEDSDSIKILACMLQASADVYEIYRQKGISDEIYFDTMKCYTRFIDETCRMTGRLYFDRFWWTTRQAGGHLFRIGELEYEMKHLADRVVIGMHIPSDADLSPAAVDRSLQGAKAFFADYYPHLKNAEYRCHSWLMDSTLKGMLNESANIVRFQERFEIFDKGEVSTDFLEWLFHTRKSDAEAPDFSILPENTSLQRNIKKHLVSGGVIRDAYGKLK